MLNGDAASVFVEELKLSKHIECKTSFSCACLVQLRVASTRLLATVNSPPPKGLTIIKIFCEGMVSPSLSEQPTTEIFCYLFMCEGLTH